MVGLTTTEEFHARCTAHAKALESAARAFAGHGEVVDAVACAWGADVALIQAQLVKSRNMVKPIQSAPVVINMFHVGQTITGAATYVGHPDGKAIEREKLNQWHGEPGKVGPFLALGATVDIEYHGAFACKAKRWRW